MWMMGYNDGGDLYMHHDSFNNSRRLRPLMPRPVPTATSPNGVATGAPPPGFSRIHGADILAFNHHFANIAEHSKRDQVTTTQQVVVSSRWNPTPEQLRTLEELYRRGTRTPSADQIQHITAQLRRYGKIEGKNVFYWFQNHKARERQKRRRQLESGSDDHKRDAENSERKETGVSRAVIEAEQAKNWAPPSNCSTLAEESVVSIQKTAKASTVTEFRTTATDHRWVKFMERNDTWPSMHGSGSSCPQLINTITAPPSFELGEITMAHKLTKTPMTMTTTTTNHDFMNNNVFMASCKNNNSQIYAQIGHYSHYDTNNDDCINSQTLQLFPLKSGNDSTNYSAGEKESVAAMMTPLISGNNGFTTPHQFFEFLPIKH